MQDLPVQPKKESPKPAESATIHVKKVFALIIAAAFLDVVDFSIIQVALPTIQTEFAISLAETQWIVDAYGLMLAGVLLSAAGQATSTGKRSWSYSESTSSPLRL